MQQINWSLDNNYEYIELISNDISLNHDVREKEGFPRFMEVLQNTMWTTANKSVKNNNISKIEKNNNDVIDNNNNNNMKNPKEVIKIDDTVNNNTATNNNSVSKSNKIKNKNNTEDELENIDKFQTILEQVQQQRSKFHNTMNNTNNNSTFTVTDHERRNNAAKMAMELCALMNLDDDSDSDNSN